MPTSSLSRVLFLLCSCIFLQTDGLQTDGSRLFRKGNWWPRKGNGRPLIASVPLTQRARMGGWIRASHDNQNQGFSNVPWHKRAFWPGTKSLCFCQTQTSTWPHVAQVKRMCSVTGPQHCSVLRSLSTVIASPLKIGFQPTFDSAVLISLPLRDFGFSSPVIVIVKSYFDIWHGSRAESSFWDSLIRYVLLSRPVKSRRLNDDATDESNHIIIRRRREVENPASERAGHQDVQQWSKTQSSSAITNDIRWCQAILRRMVRRDPHLPVRHRLSGVCSGPSGSHRSQRCYHKEDLHGRSSLGDHWRDQQKECRARSSHIRSSTHGRSGCRSRKAQRGDQSSRRKERIKGSHSSQSRQFPQVCSASFNVRWSQCHGSSYHANN